VDSMGDVNIANDGATMLKEMDARTIDSEVGDGTTSAVVPPNEFW
jgi:chaperonin GroEL (HSP60 family)